MTRQRADSRDPVSGTPLMFRDATVTSVIGASPCGKKVHSGYAPTPRDTWRGPARPDPSGGVLIWRQARVNPLRARLAGGDRNPTGPAWSVGSRRRPRPSGWADWT